MRSGTIPQTVLFPDLFGKPLVATFDQPHASSDGGAILLNAAERQYGSIDGFARCLVDDRQPENDADRLAADPMQKLLLDRDPIAGDPLASQPTISRFENDVASQALYAMGRELAASVVERHRRRLHGRARRITIDLESHR